MDKSDFILSISYDNLPDHLDDIYLQCLWYDRKGDWVKAHEIIQDRDDLIARRIHAYLHRKEGDLGNADYWYRRTGLERPDKSLDDEWSEILDSVF